MVRTAVAFCPGHISGYFMRIAGKDHATTGSIGAGVAIADGVVARAVPAGSTTVTIHRRDRTGGVLDAITVSSPVESVLDKLQVQAATTTHCHLSIGPGAVIPPRRRPRSRETSRSRPRPTRWRFSGPGAWCCPGRMRPR